jgi:glycosyltransferase involved in cell wall biosynthesis
MELNSPINVSVIVCTWNREFSLRRCLDSFLELETPKNFNWEMVVVNNNSTDSTCEVLEEYKLKLPLKIVLEKELGLSMARNAGLKASQGKLILFTDDDVTVTPHWLHSYWRSFLDYPEAAFFGGEIESPIYFSPHNPDYLSESLFDGWLLRKKVDARKVWIAPEEFPFGANMGFRRSAIGTKQFSRQLGVKGKKRLCSEELDFIAQFKKGGQKGVWVTDAKVHHWISKNRLSFIFFWKYFVGLGRTDIRLNPAIPRFYRIPWNGSWRFRLAHFAIQWGRLMESKTHEKLNPSK